MNTDFISLFTSQLLQVTSIDDPVSLKCIHDFIQGCQGVSIKSWKSKALSLAVTELKRSQVEGFKSVVQISQSMVNALFELQLITLTKGSLLFLLKKLK